MPRSRYHCRRAPIQNSYASCACGGRHEVLHLHLLELAHAEEEVPRRDLVAEALADLRDAERRLHAHRVGHVLEVDEDALRRLGPQERGRALVLHRADRRLEHQVEVARLGQVAVGRLAGLLRGPLAALRRLEVVGPEAQLAGAAVDSGSEKPARWPEASHTFGCRMIAESSSTMSSRSCTIERCHSAFTFCFSSTP